MVEMRYKAVMKIVSGFYMVVFVDTAHLHTPSTMAAKSIFLLIVIVALASSLSFARLPLLQYATNRTLAFSLQIVCMQTIRKEQQQTTRENRNRSTFFLYSI